MNIRTWDSNTKDFWQVAAQDGGIKAEYEHFTFATFRVRSSVAAQPGLTRQRPRAQSSPQLGSSQTGIPTDGVAEERWRQKGPRYTESHQTTETPTEDT